MQLKILLSLDHELSLGGAASYARNLFDPTELVMRVAEELQVPLTLFTDVCCAIRFKKWDYERFCQPYERQICQALAGGHDVQLHLHPHWLESIATDVSSILLPPPSASATLAFETSQLREGTWTEKKHSSCCAEVRTGLAYQRLMQDFKPSPEDGQD